MKIRNIKAEPNKANLNINTTGNADDTLTFSLYDYEDASSVTGYHLAREESFNTYQDGEDKQTHTVNDLNTGTYSL